MTRLNTLDWIALIFLIIGGINWGVVGLSAIWIVVISVRLHKVGQ